MPENFASLLEALDAEGRGLARPAPATVIETLGRARRRRHRFTAATSAVAVCALAAGVALGVGGGAAGRPAPTMPVPSPPSATASASASGSASGPHQAVVSANRTGLSALMQPSELPQPALFQWSSVGTHLGSRAGGTVPSVCGFDPTLKNFQQVHSQSEDSADYSAAADESDASESIYHYASAAAARADYDILKPDLATCSSAHVTATVTDGAAWQDASSGTASLHRMIVLSGSDIAYWFYAFQGSGKPYDSSDDQAALQRMADRLEGRTPVPDPVTAPPANTLPASAWLDPSQIPFATADRSHGWVPFGGQQEAPSGKKPANLCAAIDDGEDLVAQDGADVLTRSYHGTPSTTPVYPGSNYLYSSADEHIVSFPGGAEQAQAAFTSARVVIGLHGCQFADGSGGQTRRKLTVGATTDTGFSLLATDTPGPSYEHLYCVIKGSHVAWMMINFEQGDTATGGDAAILASMAARLP
ncbi:hypothetical protein ABH926_005690 [Catenulispora sp. GP43]|uniref:hypothetical protein n=1 Tax=Catenulispora sp. GP43 TaxID=3156263 RepID=UPI003514FA6D